MSGVRHLAVVGGGITGLAAAWEAAASPGWRVTVVDSDDRVGGKLRTSQIAGLPVDESADAFLRRVPDALDLTTELGLADELVAPATGTAHLWCGDRLRPLPTGGVFGIPLDTTVTAPGIVDQVALQRALAEVDRDGDPLDRDVAIGGFLDERLGPEVSRRLVAPLVGGIGAGDVDELSLDAVLPQIATAARSGPSVVAALRAARPTTAPAGPVFAAHPLGMGHLVDTLTSALVHRGVEFRTGTEVEAVTPGRPGRTTVVGPDITLDADAVVVATPPSVAARLVAGAVPAAATLLSGITTASVVLVTLAWPAAELGELEGSGFLVPRGSGLRITACSWASTKWAHLATTGSAVLRVSVGHAGDPGAVDLDDSSLLSIVSGDLERSMGITSAPAEQRISRWPGSFPQYLVGHLDRCDAIDAALAEAALPLAVTGAGHRGLGIPACIRQGRAAARLLIAEESR